MMKAVVIHQAGGPENLRLEQIPIPKPAIGQVLIRVKAFGLNRSELFTRQGLSPVQFPRVLGIEAVGIVEEAPGNEFAKGQTVLTAMGGIGRVFDGGYAEFTCPPTGNVKSFETKLPWEIIGSLPEMLQTAYGALFKSLKLQKGNTLLIRGGTTSVGLVSAAMARNHGVKVLATTRKPERGAMMRANGVDEVVIETGEIAAEVKKIYPVGVDKVLELVGTTTLKDSLQCAARGGSVCMVGMVGSEWSLDSFAPMDSIPSCVNLTTYSGGVEDVMSTPYTDLLREVEAGKLKVQIGKVFKMGEIVEAHRMMEDNTAGGKIVVLT